MGLWRRMGTQCGFAHADASRISLLQWYQHKFNRSKLRIAMEAVNTLMSLVSVCTYVYDTYVAIPTICRAVYFACSVTFSVEYVARLLAATDVLRYLFWDWSLVDVATIIYGIGFFVDEDISTGFGFIRLLRIIQVVRLCKAVTSIVLQYSRRSSQPMQLEIVRRSADLAVTLVAVIFISACVFYELEVAGQELYFHNAIYWACVTISTVGYGDFAPETVAGQLLFPLVFIIIILLLPRKISDLSTVLQAYSRYARKSHRSARFGLHVVLTGHVANRPAQTFISEFFHKGRGYQEMDVVLLSPDDPHPELIITMNNPRWEKHVQYLNGSPFHAEDLARADTGRALAVFVLANKYAPDPVAEDSRTLLAVLAVAQFLRQYGSPADVPPPRVVSWSTTSWKGRHELDSHASHPHIIAQFLLNETLDNAIALLQAGAHHPPEIGLIPLNVSPFPICVGTLRASLLGASLHTPGLITLVANLCISSCLERKRGLHQEDVSMLTGCGWLSEYLAGAAVEIYDVTFPKPYWGCSFKQAALQLWQDEHVILIGLRFSQHENPEEWFDVKLAPLASWPSEQRQPQSRKRQRQQQDSGADAAPEPSQGRGDDGSCNDNSDSSNGGRERGGGGSAGGGLMVIDEHTVGYILSTEALVLGSASRGFRNIVEDVDAMRLGNQYLIHQHQTHQNPPTAASRSEASGSAEQRVASSSAPEPEPADTVPPAPLEEPPLPSRLSLAQPFLPRVDEYPPSPGQAPSLGATVMQPLQPLQQQQQVLIDERAASGFGASGAPSPLPVQLASPGALLPPSLADSRAQSAPGWSLLGLQREGWAAGPLGRLSRRGGAAAGAGPVHEEDPGQPGLPAQPPPVERRQRRWFSLAAVPPLQRSSHRGAAGEARGGDQDKPSHGSGNWLSRQSAAVAKMLTAAVAARTSADIAMSSRRQSAATQASNGPIRSPDLVPSPSLPAAAVPTRGGGARTQSALGPPRRHGHLGPEEGSLSRGSRSILSRITVGAISTLAGSDAPGSEEPRFSRRDHLVGKRVKSMLNLLDPLATRSSAEDSAATAATATAANTAAATAAAAAATRTRRQQGFKATVKALDLHALAAVSSFTYRRAITRRVSRGSDGSPGPSPVYRGPKAAAAAATAAASATQQPATPNDRSTTCEAAVPPAASPPLPRIVGTFAGLEPLDSPVIISGSSCFSQLVHLVAAVRSAPLVGRARHFRTCPLVIVDSGDTAALSPNQLEALAYLPDSHSESIFVLHANLADPRDLEKLNLKLKRKVDALILPSIDQFTEETVAGSAPALADGQVLLAANALRRYCEEMDCDLRVVTEVLALLNCSYALPLCLAEGPYTTHSKSTLMGAHLSVAPHPTPSPGGSGVPFVTDPRPDFRRSLGLAVARLHQSPQARQEDLVQYFLSKMPHLTPSLATGHILMQTFMDALSCQMINCWDTATGEQQAQQQHHHQRHRQEQQHRRRQVTSEREARVAAPVPPLAEPQPTADRRRPTRGGAAVVTAGSASGAGYCGQGTTGDPVRIVEPVFDLQTQRPQRQPGPAVLMLMDSPVQLVPSGPSVPQRSAEMPNPSALSVSVATGDSSGATASAAQVAPTASVGGLVDGPGPTAGPQARLDCGGGEETLTTGDQHAGHLSAAEPSITAAVEEAPQLGQSPLPLPPPASATAPAAAASEGSQSATVAAPDSAAALAAPPAAHGLAVPSPRQISTPSHFQLQARVATPQPQTPPGALQPFAGVAAGAETAAALGFAAGAVGPKPSEAEGTRPRNAGVARGGTSSADDDHGSSGASDDDAHPGGTSAYTVRVFSLNFGDLRDRVPGLAERLLVAQARQRQKQLERQSEGQSQQRVKQEGGQHRGRCDGTDQDPDPDPDRRQDPDLCAVLVDAHDLGLSDDDVDGRCDERESAVSFGALFEVLVTYYDMLPLGLYRRDVGGEAQHPDRDRDRDRDRGGDRDKMQEGGLGVCLHRQPLGGGSSGTVQAGRLGCGGGWAKWGCSAGGRRSGMYSSDQPEDAPAPSGGRDYGVGGASGIPYVYTKPEPYTTWLRPSDDVFLLTCQAVVTRFLGEREQDQGL